MAKDPTFRIEVIVMAGGYEFKLCEPFEDHAEAEAKIRHILRRTSRHVDDLLFAMRYEETSEKAKLWFVRRDDIVAARTNVVEES